MDSEKFQTRIIYLIKKSLPVQHLQKAIEPIELVEEQGAYFLIKCKVDGKPAKCVFLRNGKYLFYLYGMNKLPEEGEKRKYEFHVRQPAGEKKNNNEEAKEQLEAERLKIADELVQAIVSKTKTLAQSVIRERK